MTTVIDDIKAKVDVVEEIGLVVVLHKSGKTLKGVCPFHNERTPSFYVFPENQSWHCFGCNEHGDIFTFVQKHQGLDFREALEYLAQKAGVPLEDHSGRDPEEERAASAARERLRKLNDDAMLWFHQLLLRSREASEARNYVQSRGITVDTVINFGLGYAPEQWDGLTNYLLNQGYTEQELVNGGLARRRELDDEAMHSGGVYDYFRHRIIFPIRDIRGRVIGFGGRALGDGKPKYLNSPQTLLFEKNSVLYAIDMAKEAIKQAKQVIIVEGYVDAVVAHQYGTRQTVACIGSAITEKHIQQLKKLTRQVTLALDPDEAGYAATEHGIQEALKSFDRTVVPVPLPGGGESRSNGGKQKQKTARGIIRLEEQVDAEINVLQLPPGKDPDEVIRDDYAAWLYAVTHPLPLIDYYFVARTSDLNLREPQGRTEAARRLIPVVGMISDRIKRDAYLQKLAKMISISERVVHEELQRYLQEQKRTGITARFSDTGGRRREGGRDDGKSGKERFAGFAGAVNDKKIHSELEPAGRRREHENNGLDRRSDDTLQWEDYLIGLLLQNPGLHAHVCGIITDGDFAGTDTRELYRILNSIEQRASSPSQQSLAQLLPSALQTAVARAQKCVESRSPKDGTGLVKAAIQCATRLKRTRLVQLNTELEYMRQEAVSAGDVQVARQLQLQQLDITRQLHTILSATHLYG